MSPVANTLPRAAIVAVALSAGGATAIVAASATGALDPPVLGDPGASVRFAIPVLKVMVDLAAALTVGMLVLAATVLPGDDERSRPGQAHAPALAWASGSAGLWAVSTLALGVFSYADIAGIPMSQPGFGPQLAAFLTRVDLGRGLFFTMVVAAGLSLFAAAARSLRAVGLLSLIAFVALVPAALTGHAGSATDHETAVTALGLHLLGLCVWMGGLASLVLLRPGLSRTALTVAAQRFSTLALWGFGAVAVSGVISAWVRVGDLSGLATAYGALVLAKTTALLLLGAAGWWHRRRTLARLTASTGAQGFWRLATGELTVMTIAVGLAVALARSSTPVPQVPPAEPTLAQSLTGYPMPPEPTVVRWFTLWQPDLLWLVVAGVVGGLYLAGAVRLRRRGDRWPVARTACWLVGLVVLTWVTSGGPIVYGRVLFSAHMSAHMIMAMAVPLFLVLAAPITLALRALPARSDGSRGPREWVLAVVDSPVSKVVAHPVVAATLFAAGPFAVYFSGLFPLALRTHVGHELMQLHFLASGYLFLWVLIGVDPGPRRARPPFRMLVLFITVSVHAFFGVTLMSATTVLAQEYFGALGRTWGKPLLEDQSDGGAIAWGFGELPMLAVALILAVQWSRSDAREARRLDRAADRDGDADLVAYNAMLARMSGKDPRDPF